MKFTYTRCGVNQKVLVERQDVVLSSIRYLRMVRELREAGDIVVMKLTFISLNSFATLQNVLLIHVNTCNT